MDSKREDDRELPRWKCAVSSLKILRSTQVVTLRPPLYEATMLIVNN